MKYNTNILFIFQYKNKPGIKGITVLTSLLELFCYRHLSKLYSKKGYVVKQLFIIIALKNKSNAARQRHHDESEMTDYL